MAENRKRPGDFNHQPFETDVDYQQSKKELLAENERQAKSLISLMDANGELLATVERLKGAIREVHNVEPCLGESDGLQRAEEILDAALKEESYG